MRSQGGLVPLCLVAVCLFLGSCWIPLPEETAVVVNVLDAANPANLSVGSGNVRPVEGVVVLLDGQASTTNQNGGVFRSFDTAGDHLLQVDAGSLVDPQGGRSFILSGSHLSGERQGAAVLYADRPFALTDSTIVVPVEKGSITVATVYLQDMLVSPADNQWLTDGSDGDSPYRSGNGGFEYQDAPEPTFWWRQEPSIVSTVGTPLDFTFQLWEDDDGDTRYPLGIVDVNGYNSAMDATDPTYIQPDWQVPLSGLQRARAAGGAGQVRIWSGQATGSSFYDVYYAPTPLWDGTEWENNSVYPGVTSAADGGALRFDLGPGTVNPGALFKNGVPHTFGLRARDGSANLDATVATSTREAVPPSSASAPSWSGVPSVSAVADSALGGAVVLSFGAATGGVGALSYRVYAAPTADFDRLPFHERNIRATVATTAFTLQGLINGVSYTFGVEPIDTVGNFAQGVTAIATPSSASALDTTAPVWSDGSGGVTVTPTASPGEAAVSFPQASDANTVTYRLYWAPAALSSADAEALWFTDYPSTVSTPVTVGGLVNGVSYRFTVRALDPSGNSVPGQSTLLTLTAGAGPVWETDDPALFSSVIRSSGSTVRHLGWKYDWNGFALTRSGSGAGGRGEYVWRVIQENPDLGLTPIRSKLAAFYLYPEYHFKQNGVDVKDSGTVDHENIFTVMDSLLSSATILGSDFDFDATIGPSSQDYLQRTATGFLNNLQNASTPDTVNQLMLLYSTDSDGEASSNIIRINVMNRQTDRAGDPPELQYKDYFVAYDENSDSVFDPFSPFNFESGNDHTSEDYRDPNLLDPGSIIP